MTFGLLFTIKLTISKYLLVEIEDGVEGEMPDMRVFLFINGTYVMFLMTN